MKFLHNPPNFAFALNSHAGTAFFWNNAHKKETFLIRNSIDCDRKNIVIKQCPSSSGRGSHLNIFSCIQCYFITVFEVYCKTKKKLLIVHFRAFFGKHPTYRCDIKIPKNKNCFYIQLKILKQAFFLGVHPLIPCCDGVRDSDTFLALLKHTHAFTGVTSVLFCEHGVTGTKEKKLSKHRTHTRILAEWMFHANALGWRYLLLKNLSENIFFGQRPTLFDDVQGFLFSRTISSHAPSTTYNS